MKMDDDVFTASVTSSAIPDLSCPPPGWGGGGPPRYRGRGGEAGSHPTRVIKRTDLRNRGGQQRGHYQQQQQKPPRFSNLQDRDWASPDTERGQKRRSSLGDTVWRPGPEAAVSPPEGRVSGEMMEGREESSSDEGEWKEVKGRRNNNNSNNSNRVTPPPHASGQRRKTPEPLMSANHGKKKSPPRPRPSPEPRHGHRNQEKAGSRKSRSPPTAGRRGSASSSDGDTAAAHGRRPSVPGSATTSPAAAAAAPNHEELMKLIPEPQMMMVSDLPDEQMARTKRFSRRLSETELLVKQHEESIHLQGEILSFLKKTWKEISLELKESEHHWPPKICYFKI